MLLQIVIGRDPMSWNVQRTSGRALSCCIFFFVVVSLHCTEVGFASFLSGEFTTMAVINPPERKLVKRISVQFLGWDIFLPFLTANRVKLLPLCSDNCGMFYINFE